MAGMIDVMVDIETTGTDPAHSAVIQIAAVRFDVEDKTIDTTSMFDRALWIPPNRWWDEDTREWWGRQKAEVLDDIYSRMEDPQVVMKALFDWVQGISLITPVRLWAKPISFEFPFLSSYFKQHGLKMPFHYRYAVDLNSYILGRGHHINPFWKGIEPPTDAHNALNDVIFQIDGALRA